MQQSRKKFGKSVNVHGESRTQCDIDSQGAACPRDLGQIRLCALGSALYILITMFAEAIFVELYCHWHGAQFLLPNPLNFYSPENIKLLSNITFVATGPDGGPTVMSMTAEILMWSSLGIWAQRIAGMVKRYDKEVPDLPRDLAVYIGIRNS